MTKRVLAISGKRFSGKDTFAALLMASAARRGLRVDAYAFAAESKRMFAEREHDVDLSKLLLDRAYKEALRPRLTAFTVAALAEDPLVFCRAVADLIVASPTTPPSMRSLSLVSDMRLRLEAAHFRSRFSLRLLRLVRSDEARAASGWTYVPAVDDHYTETDLDDASLWDEVVPNDGTVEELAARADAIIASEL